MPIEREKIHSLATIAKLREALHGVVSANDAILTCGSYARREASAQSDIDFYSVVADGRIPDWSVKAHSAISKIVPKEPSIGGAFGEAVGRDSIIKNIGGDGDTNKNLTHRILFLLEGEWLANQAIFQDLRRRVLERYISSEMTDHQLTLFLLNDIIRYYRTIAVDYEFKTVEQDQPKPWAVRNIKLIFSRKLLYTSGVFSVALTADRSRDEKIRLLERLFDLPVIERMADICGDAAVKPILKSYSTFLERMEEEAYRKSLDNLQPNERKSHLFRDLKNEGHHFTQCLMKLFDQTFGSSHPIHRAIRF